MKENLLVFDFTSRAFVSILSFVVFYFRKGATGKVSLTLVAHSMHWHRSAYKIQNPDKPAPCLALQITTDTLQTFTRPTDTLFMGVRVELVDSGFSQARPARIRKRH